MGKVSICNACAMLPKSRRSVQQDFNHQTCVNALRAPPREAGDACIMGPACRPSASRVLLLSSGPFPPSFLLPSSVFLSLPLLSFFPPSSFLLYSFFLPSFLFISLLAPLSSLSFLSFLPFPFLSLSFLSFLPFLSSPLRRWWGRGVVGGDW